MCYGLDKYIFPVLGKKPITKITLQDILSVVRVTEQKGQNETSRRLLQIIKQIFRYAVITGRTPHNIAADLHGAVQPRKTVHRASITDTKQVGQLLRDIEEYGGYLPVKYALRLAPLVFVRPSELRCATCDNPTSSPQVNGSPTKAYCYHYINIRNHMEIEDFSRMDAMVALRMRSTGHSPQAVLESIRECAPNVRWNEGRDWQKYAERTTNYAFGVAGDIALRDYEGYFKHWYKIEHGEFPKEEQKQQQGNQYTVHHLRM